MTCTEEIFLKDIADHKINIIRDEGVYRHIQFREPGTIIYGFDLVTWPGHLCITGDCGTYVFSRTEDMFGFFRTGQSYAANHPERTLFINPSYWGEKLLCIDRHAGFKEFDKNNFKDRVTEYFKDWKEFKELTDDAAEALWKEIEDSVLSQGDSHEHDAYSAVYSFYSNGFTFQDFFDGGGTESFTSNYLWCLYAINWGISQYDAKKREIIQASNQPVSHREGKTAHV